MISIFVLKRALKLFGLQSTAHVVKHRPAGWAAAYAPGLSGSASGAAARRAVAPVMRGKDILYSDEARQRWSKWRASVGSEG